MQLVARLVQQPQGLPEVRPHLLGRAVHRVPVRLGEDRRRHLVAQAFQYRELLALRQPGGGKLGAGEERVDAAVEAVEDRAVDVLEIEGEVEGAPHAGVLEPRAAQVHHEGLHRPGRPHREFFPDDAPLPTAGKS